MEFIISVRDNATSVTTKLSSTFEAARKNAAQFQSVAKGLPLTINDIKAEMSALEYKKGFAKTKNEIVKINTLLHSTKGQLQKLENLPPKGFLNRMDSLTRSVTGFSLKNIGFAMFAQQSMQFIKGSTQLFDTQAKAEAQLKASIQSTGNAAGRSFAELTAAASAMQNKTIFGDEEILRAQSVLLTFKQIRGAVFDQAMPAIADLATKLGTDLNSAVLQVGKALNDPAEGFAALKRSGIQFSDEQIDSVKKLVAAGDIQSAQFIMLKELQDQFGGSAEAAAKAGLGPMKQLSNLWGDFREIVGKLTLNLVNHVVPVFKSLVGWMVKNEEAMKSIGKIVLIAGVAFLSYKGVLLASSLVTKGLTTATLIHRGVVFLTTIATQGLTKAMIVLNGVSKANVFAALAGAAIAAVTAFKLFKKGTEESAAAVERAKEIGQDYYSKEKMNLDLIFEKLKRTNPMSKERNKLVDELKEMYPELNKQILDEVRNTNDLSAAYSTLINNIRIKSKVRAKEGLLDELYKQQGDIELQLRGIFQNAQDWSEKRNEGWEPQALGTPLTSEQRIDQEIDKINNLRDNYNMHYEDNGLLAQYLENLRLVDKVVSETAKIQMDSFGSGGSSGAVGGGSGDSAVASKALDSITGGGKSMKQIYINIDNLVGVNNNNFTADQDPGDATSFMEKLTNTLQMIVNDTNYATN
ncbi:MAG: hypothetical protein PHV07_07125 [Oscillospiraceae bacterium]|nr:hypothetical protein [Oscillospiraceae bacterium]